MKSRSAGFTLVEIAVSMAIATILMAAVGSIMVYGNRTFLRNAVVVRAEQLGNAAVELVAGKLQYADTVVIDNQQTGDQLGNVIEFTADGVFLINQIPVYGDYEDTGLYWGCRISLQNRDNGILQFEVYMKDRVGDIMYQSRKTVRLLNMELRENSIEYRIEKEIDVLDSKSRGVRIFYQDNSQEYGDDK